MHVALQNDAFQLVRPLVIWYSIRNIHQHIIKHLWWIKPIESSHILLNNLIMAPPCNTAQFWDTHKNSWTEEFHAFIEATHTQNKDYPPGNQPKTCIGSWMMVIFHHVPSFSQEFLLFQRNNWTLAASRSQPTWPRATTVLGTWAIVHKA